MHRVILHSQPSLQLDMAMGPTSNQRKVMYIKGERHRLLFIPAEILGVLMQRNSA
jgi:hypothetical protein